MCTRQRWTQDDEHPQLHMCIDCPFEEAFSSREFPQRTAQKSVRDFVCVSFMCACCSFVLVIEKRSRVRGSADPSGTDSGCFGRGGLRASDEQCPVQSDLARTGGSRQQGCCSILFEVADKSWRLPIIIVSQLCMSEIKKNVRAYQSTERKRTYEISFCVSTHVRREVRVRMIWLSELFAVEDLVRRAWNQMH